MDSARRDDSPSPRSSRRPSRSLSDGVIDYVDDSPSEEPRDSSACLRRDAFDDVVAVTARDRSVSTLYPPSPDAILRLERQLQHRQHRQELDDRSALYEAPPRRKDSVCSQTKRVRSANRRASVQSTTRSRTNSCAGRPTPLGDDRRASVSKRPRTRRASNARRKDSVRPVRVEIREEEETRKVVEDLEVLEQARRHRRIAMIVLGTFFFLLTASVLVVVITLTHSTFLSPATGSRELIEHRAQLRKENEELLNSLTRDTFVPENTTAPS